MKHIGRDFYQKIFFHFYMMITGVICFCVKMFRGEKVLFQSDNRKLKVLEILEIEKNSGKVKIGGKEVYKPGDRNKKRKLPCMNLETCRGSPEVYLKNHSHNLQTLPCGIFCSLSACYGPVQTKFTVMEQISLFVPTRIFGPQIPVPEVTILCIGPF